MIEPGMCVSCRWERKVSNRRGSVFTLCAKASADPTLPKYPRLPVLQCHGFECREPDPATIGGLCPKQVTLGAQHHFRTGYQLFTDRIQRWIRNLGKQLFEVVVKEAGAVRKHG